jgi:hypothetical protein
MKIIALIACVIFVVTAIGCGPDVRIVNFDTKQEAYFKGDSVKLIWIVENADSVTLNGMPVQKDSGWKAVKFDTAKTYVLRAVNKHSERENYMHVVQ